MNILVGRVIVFTIIAFILNAAFQFTYAQSQNISISGKVTDESGKPLFGVNIYFENTDKGTNTDEEGNYFFTTTLNTTRTMVATMVGFQKYKEVFDEPGKYVRNITLSEDILFGEEIVVSASRIEENSLRSPVTIEKLNLRQISEMPTPNFYDGLYRLKGVDMNVQSLTFRTPNTRGFNGTTNFRFNQIIDGVLNTSPGLNFAAGNLLGISQIDVESVELLTGASSALYGTGGMNGTLLITSKDPFEYQGLSGSVQVGAMHVGVDYQDPSPYYDVSLRWAKSFSDKLAVKATLSYLEAQDWIANDYRDKTNLDDNSSTRESNPGYDGVNIYGDENALNMKVIAPAVADGFAQTNGLTPGTSEYDSVYNFIFDLIPDQKLTRTGWEEKHLVNYDARNLKTGLALSYKLNDDLRINVEGNYASGQAVYTAQNRFSINDFTMYRAKAEITNPNYYVRYWYVGENSGKAYDAGATAALINESWKPSELWFQDYIAGFLQSRLTGGNEDQAHKFARLLADNRTANGVIQDPEKPALPLAGSPEFQAYFNDITNKSINDGGSAIFDFSSMMQLEGMYNFRDYFENIDLMVGFQYRRTKIDSDGTVYFDKTGPIFLTEWGVYAQYIDRFLNDRLKLNLSARYDKHEYFRGEVTPRASLVYSAGPDRKHNIRASAQTAFRFAATSDQWLDINVGGVRVVGGLEEVQNSYGFDEEPLYPLVGANPVLADPDTTNGAFIIPEFEPETMVSYEIGYKGLLFNDRIMIDFNSFISEYDGFHAYQSLVQNPFTTEERRFQTTISTPEKLRNWGWAVGMDYQFFRVFYMGANVAYNELISEISPERGYQSRFNTPNYRFNISLGSNRITKRMGFNISYRWQEAFLWESSFGSGIIPAFGTLDMQVNFRLPKIKSAIKIGGSNILNQAYTTSLGSAQIRGLYYVSFTYDQLFKY